MKLMISSTSALQHHREQVVDACLRCGCIPLSQDMKSSEPSKPIEFSLELVTQCDAIIVLVGPYYGSIPMGEEKSFCEMEYEHALNNSKLVLLFFLEESSGEWIAKKNQDLKAYQRQMRFLRSAQDRWAGIVFHNPDDLRERVMHSTTTG